MESSRERGLQHADFYSNDVQLLALESVVQYTWRVQTATRLLLLHTKDSPSSVCAALLLAGRFLLGQASLVLWLVWAWGQRSTSAAAANSKHGTAIAMPAKDPFISLLLAALPLSAEQQSMAAVLLPAALYEGLLGTAAVTLMLGRWAAWLLLWELWLCCCCMNCRCRSTGLQETVQPVQAHFSASARQGVCSHPWQQQQQLLGQHKLLGHGSSSSSSSSSSSTSRAQWLLVCLSRPVLLAAAQLLLPVCMAVAAVRRG
jgi:hypothetical protein